MAEQDARGALELAENMGRAEGLAEGEARGRAAGLAEGEARGRAEGLAAGLRRNLEDLCELLSIELTPARRAGLERADAFRQLITGALDQVSQREAAVSQREAATAEVGEAQRQRIIADYAAEHGLTRERLGQAIASFKETAAEELDAVGEINRLMIPGGGKPWLPAELIAELALHDWPGNVRQLRNVARQLVVANRGAADFRIPTQVERLLRG